MTQYDVFNGDADGLCALHQLRLAEPADSVLITGVKRDIALLKRVQVAAGDHINVLDVSLEKNHDALVAALDAGAQVRYIDHHFPGDIPVSDALQTHIDTDAETCTGLIVDGLLDGKYRAWAVTAAFGDNLQVKARAAAEPLGLDAADIDRLERLGTLLNYNGYGASVEDLHFAPDDLSLRLRPFESPFDFMQQDDAWHTLEAGYEDDIKNARTTPIALETAGSASLMFPNTAWARRVGGVYANELAREHPARAHALLTESADGSYLVSVRAPLENRTGADDLCRSFETGGGRKAAAGINRLPASDVDRFNEALQQRYG
jgi:hypothetical protein